MGVNERNLIWENISSNPLWIRAKMSRYQEPSGFAMAMAPERNANISDQQFVKILNWINETKFPARYLNSGIIAFETDNDKLIFMLRWS